MASPQRQDPNQLPPRPVGTPDPSDPNYSEAPVVTPVPRDRRDRAFGWWWFWVVLFIAGIVWFCGWGWFGYGGWWSHSRGTTAPTYQTQQARPSPGAATPRSTAPAQ